MTRHTRAPYRIHSGFWTAAVCLALLAPGGLAQADDQPSGKHVGNNKHVGKPSPRVLAADLNRPRPLTLATPGKLTAPAPHVRDAIVQLSARSTTPARVRTSSRGALQRFVLSLKASPLAQLES